VNVIQSILLQCTWVEPVEILEKPKDTLQKQCLFLTRYSRDSGPSQDAMVCFSSYDEDPISNIEITTQFNPINLVSAFAHGIAWDHGLNA
jgi:hypothetical protein